VDFSTPKLDAACKRFAGRTSPIPEAGYGVPSLTGLKPRLRQERSARVARGHTGEELAGFYAAKLYRLAFFAIILSITCGEFPLGVTNLQAITEPRA
jgi:hypothetical protein